MKKNNKNRARLALAELEKELEVLSKQDLNACKAGAVFFSLSGAYLGKFGESDLIRIVSEDEFKRMLNEPLLTDPQIDCMGDDIYKATDETKVNIINHYAQGMNLPSPIMGVSGYKEIQAGFDKDGKNFYYNKYGFSLERESSIISTLQHESYHNSPSGCMQGTGDCEVQAILYQVSRPEYDNTTEEYRRFTAEYLLEKYEEANGAAGVCINSTEEAYRICKVNGY